MTPFGGAVFTLFLPFLVFRIGYAVWDICWLRRERKLKQTPAAKRRTTASAARSSRSSRR